jgi:hypothetical protein
MQQFAAALYQSYRDVRCFTEKLCEPLQTEDYVVQSMADVSPTKWHIAHTSWFFETFLLKANLPDYQSPHPQYDFLLTPITMPWATVTAVLNEVSSLAPLLKKPFTYRAFVDAQWANFWSKPLPSNCKVWRRFSRWVCITNSSIKNCS